MVNKKLKIIIIAISLLAALFIVHVFITSNQEEKTAEEKNNFSEKQNEFNEKQNNFTETQSNPLSKHIETSNGQEIINECGNRPGAQTPRAFTEQELAAAENALAKGSVISDPQNDWLRIPEGVFQGDKYDNPQPYSLPWTDLKNFYIGADEKYIYFKIQTYGIFPKEAARYEGDLITQMGVQIIKMKFGPNEDDSVQFQDSIGYLDPANQSRLSEYPNLGMLALIIPTKELDEYFDTIYKNYSCGGMIAGGAGTDYLLSARPLEMARLKFGDVTTFAVSFEAHSEKYHHSSIDNLFDVKSPSKVGTDASVIRYKLGSNTYENLNASINYYKG